MHSGKHVRELVSCVFEFSVARQVCAASQFLMPDKDTDNISCAAVRPEEHDRGERGEGIERGGLLVQLLAAATGNENEKVSTR